MPPLKITTQLTSPKTNTLQNAISSLANSADPNYIDIEFPGIGTIEICISNNKEPLLRVSISSDKDGPRLVYQGNIFKEPYTRELTETEKLLEETKNLRRNNLSTSVGQEEEELTEEEDYVETEEERI